MIENLNPRPAGRAITIDETEPKSELMRKVEAIKRASMCVPGIRTCMYFEPIFDEEGRNVNFDRNTTTTEVRLGNKDYKHVSSYFHDTFYEKDGDDWKEIYQENREMPEYAKEYWNKQNQNLSL